MEPRPGLGLTGRGFGARQHSDTHREAMDLQSMPILTGLFT